MQTLRGDADAACWFLALRLCPVFSSSFFDGGGRGDGGEGKWVFSHCPLADLTVLVTAVWMRDITEPKFDSWRTKLTQTKIQRST